jgi:integrase
MAVKIRRLSSGNYNARVYVGKDKAGKRKYESITDPDKRIVAMRAAEISIEARKRKKTLAADLTIGEAIDKYIEKQTPFLSTSTIRGYKKCRECHYKSIAGIKLGALDNDILSDYLVELSKTKSQGTRPGKPLSLKTVNNIWHLLTAAINTYHPDFKIQVAPQTPQPVFYNTPDVNGIIAILKAAAGEKIEIAVYLAARCGLRASEILGLRWGDISEDHIYIHRVRVTGVNGSEEKDRTKTISSTRFYLLSPDQSAFLRKMREGHTDDERILDMTVENLSKTFCRLLKRNNLPHCRFHDLRHAYASIEHLNGTPDAYIMRQGGWTSTKVLHKVYTQTFDDDMRRFAAKSDELFRVANASQNASQELKSAVV